MRWLGFTLLVCQLFTVPQLTKEYKGALEPGAQTSHHLAKGTRHIFRLNLDPDKVLCLLTRQHSVDVSLTLKDVQGQELKTVDDQPKFAREEFWYRSAQAGPIFLEVSAADGTHFDTGGYALDLRMSDAPADQLAERASREEVDLVEALHGYRRANRFYHLGRRLLQEGVLHRNSEPELALSYFEEALRAFSKCPPEFRVGIKRANTWTFMGRCYRKLCRFEDARIAITEAIRLHKRYEEDTDETSAVLDLAELLNMMNQGDRALELLKNRSGQTPGQNSRLALQRGWVAYQDKRYEAALDHMEDANRLSPSYGAAHARKALVLSALGRSEEAMAALEVYFQLVGSEWAIINGRAREAEVMFDACNMERAEALAHETLIYYSATNNWEGMVHALYLMARIDHEEGRSERALVTVNFLAHVLQLMLDQAVDQDNQARILAARHYFTEFTLGLMMAGERAEAAFAVFEGSRRDRLRQSPGINAAQVLDVIQIGEQVDQYLIDLARSRAFGNDFPGYQKLDELMFLEEAERLRFLQGKPAAPCPPRSISRLQSLLDNDSHALVFALGDRSSFLWEVDRDGLRAHRLPPRETIENRLREVLPLLYDTTDLKTRTAKLAALSRMLLGEVDLHKPRLIVVPDGLLHLLPLDVLPRPGERAPMLVHLETVYLPSLSILADLRERENARVCRPGMTIFYDPVFNPSDERLAHVTVTPGHDSGLARLYFTRDEAEAVKNLIPAESLRAYSGFQANLTQVLRELETPPMILHFATHAVVLENSGKEAKLVLSLWDERGNPQAGFLRDHYLKDFRIDSELVVLSACDSGMGEIPYGQSTASLPRTLLCAGAARVIYTLAPIDDRATSRLMKSFYTALFTEDMAPSAALHAARLALYRATGDEGAAAWAPIVFMGDWKKPRLPLR